MTDLITLQLSGQEIREIIESLPADMSSIKSKLQSAIELHADKATRPHKLIDDFNYMKNCPYRDDWHYCCRCRFDNICTGSNHCNKDAVKRYIEENRGK
jgi:hypothetical protein